MVKLSNYDKNSCDVSLKRWLGAQFINEYTEHTHNKIYHETEEENKMNSVFVYNNFSEEERKDIDDSFEYIINQFELLNVGTAVFKLSDEVSFIYYEDDDIEKINYHFEHRSINKSSYITDSKPELFYLTESEYYSDRILLISKWAEIKTEILKEKENFEKAQNEAKTMIKKIKEMKS